MDSIEDANDQIDVTYINRYTAREEGIDIAGGIAPQRYTGYSTCIVV
jgi:hypothetical protein